MRGDKKEMLDDLDMAMGLIRKARRELMIAEVKNSGEIRRSPNGEWHLSKIIRDCTVARELLLSVKEGCIDD